MLAVSWTISRWSVKRFDLNSNVDAALMGAIAFAILMLAETGVAVLAFGMSVGEQVAGYWAVPGAIGLFAQICFSCFPFLQVRRIARLETTPPKARETTHG